MLEEQASERDFLLMDEVLREAPILPSAEPG